MMTSDVAMTELLRRLSAMQGAAVDIGNDELDSWPEDAVAALKAARMLVQVEPVFRTECSGCERRCFKPVEVLPAEGSRPAQVFIACNEPEDMGRIDVEPRALERWRITGEILARALSRILSLDLPHVDSTGRRWSLGQIMGTVRSAHVVLAIDEVAMLLVAGHAMPVIAITRCDSSGLSVDMDELVRRVDRPAVKESPEEHCERIWNRVQHLKTNRVHGFLQQVAREEGRSVSRIKQLCTRFQKQQATLKAKKNSHR